MKKGRFGAPEGDQWYGAFFTVRSSNMTDMPGQGKVKRSSAVLPVYIDKKSRIELGVSGDGFDLGKAGSSQVLKNLKDFRFFNTCELPTLPNLKPSPLTPNSI